MQVESTEVWEQMYKNRIMEVRRKATNVVIVPRGIAMHFFRPEDCSPYGHVQEEYRGTRTIGNFT